MRIFSYVLLAVVSLGAMVYLSSCTGSGLVDTTDPIRPSPELKEGVVDPQSRAITITKEGIAVTSEHWSRYKVNQKYTTVDMRSPFYYLETWEQAFQSEAFYVTIKNDTPRNVVVNFKESIMKDERQYVYRPMGLEELKYKFVTKRMMDMKTKNGLEIAPQIMLNEMLSQKNYIEAGKSVSGFLVYNMPSSQATKVWLTVALEKEPDTSTGSYEKVNYQFDYTQDLVLRSKQPAIKR